MERELCVTKVFFTCKENRFIHSLGYNTFYTGLQLQSGNVNIGPSLKLLFLNPEIRSQEYNRNCRVGTFWVIFDEFRKVSQKMLFRPFKTSLFIVPTGMYSRP